MTIPLSAVIASRLEKPAVDNGFDQELPLCSAKTLSDCVSRI